MRIGQIESAVLFQKARAFVIRLFVVMEVFVENHWHIQDPDCPKVASLSLTNPWVDLPCFT